MSQPGQPSIALTIDDVATRRVFVTNLGVSDATVQLPDNTAGFLDGDYVDVINEGPAVITFVPVGSATINPIAHLTLNPGDRARVLFTSATTNVWDIDTTFGTFVFNLSDLHDVALDYLQGGQYLTYDGQNWVNSYGAPHYLANDQDVNIGNPTQGQYLGFNATNRTWTNMDLPSGGGGGVDHLSELLDVNLTYGNPNEFLKFNGGAWVNDHVYLGGTTDNGNVFDVRVSGVSDAQYLGWSNAASKWVNLTLPSSSGGPIALSDLTDVALQYVQNGQFLQYESGTWFSVDAVFKPKPLNVITDTTLAYDFGSSAQHNTIFRSTANTDVQILVHSDESFLGNDQYFDNQFNPTNPGPMPIGGSALFGKHGSGNVTFVPDSGVIINSPYSLTMNVLHAKATLIKVGPNEWDLEGHLAA